MGKGILPAHEGASPPFFIIGTHVCNVNTENPTLSFHDQSVASFGGKFQKSGENDTERERTTHSLLGVLHYTAV